MRSLTIAAVVAAATLVSTTAFAQDKAKGPSSNKKSEAVLVASAEPLPELPPPAAPATAAEPASPATTAPVSDTSASEAPKDGPAAAGTGFVFSFGSGLGAVGGMVGSDGSAVLALFGARASAYLTPNVAIAGGLQLGVGTFTAGCDGCSAGAFSVPVVGEYAFVDRSRGAYAFGGLSLFSTLRGSADANGIPVAVKVSTPADLKLGFGYRFGSTAKPGERVKGGLDLRFELDAGEFKSLSVEAGNEKIEGDIVESARGLHYAMGISLSYAFTP